MNTGQIAAARAFLEAGNFKLALAHAEKALQDDVDDTGAMDVYCDAQLKLKNFPAVETAAIDWIAKHPQDGRPYVSLLVCYAARKDKTLAKSLLGHFRSANPHDAEGIKLLDAAYALKFGDQTEGLSGLADIARDGGDAIQEQFWAARSFMSDGDFAAAYAAATDALRLGADDADAHYSVAFTSYRTLRLIKALRHANVALARNPAFAEARELRIWIMAAFFPPFFLALALFKAVMAPGGLWNQIEIALLIGLPAYAAVYVQRHFGVAVGWPLAACVLAFFIAQVLFGKASSRRAKRQQAPVQLKPF